MFKIANIFNKLKITNSLEQKQSNDQLSNFYKITKNWYEERSDKIIVQRNLLLVLLLMLIVLVIISIIAVTFVVNSKKFKPFVIQIDNSTGMATIVNPISSRILNGNDALSRYFIKKYLIARETYNPVDFNSNARNIIRLFSSSRIFYHYIDYIKNKNVDPILMYGQNNTTFLIMKSWSKLDKDKYMVRFSINETTGNKQVANKIAIINFEYIPMELTDAERDINPVGFQVNDYRVDDDDS